MSKLGLRSLFKVPLLQNAAKNLDSIFIISISFVSFCSFALFSNQIPAMGKWTRNIRQMEYKKIKWPVEVIARTKIDGQWKYKLRATWYDAPEVVTDCENSLDLPCEVRDETVKTIEELHEMSSCARIRKRGGVIYKCPLCGKTFAPGRKDCAESHLNGRHKGEKRKASCPVRKKDPNDDCTGPTGLDVVPVNK